MWRIWIFSFLAAAATVLPGCSREPERLLEEAFRLWRTGNYSEAVEQFHAFSLRFPKASFAPKALYLAAGGYASQLHDYPRAVSAYLSLARKYAGSDLAPEALRKVGDLHRQRLGDLRKAIVYYGMVTEQYRNSPQASESQYLIAESYMELRQYDQARVEYLQVAKDYPKTRFVPLAYYQVANSYYAESDCSEAGRYYERVLEGFPNHALAADARVAKTSCGRSVRPAIQQ